MTPFTATAATGLRHADLRQQATAHNAANRTTPATTVLRAAGRQRPDGQGVDTRVVGRPERRPALGAPAPAVGNSHPVVDGVEQIVTAHQARALAATVRTGSDLTGTLLDVVG